MRERGSVSCHWKYLKNNKNYGNRAGNIVKIMEIVPEKCRKKFNVKYKRLYENYAANI